MVHYVSDRDLAVRYEVTRQTVWKWVRERGFPSPVKLSGNCTRWKMSEIENWEREREVSR